ncbi:hypothetical protein B296_00033209 [Ensete ventricosum]|uniref:Uncharacterized protein n=1 Tax=Ensete ventricosum TaxID=4639 RepID=A0A426XDI6_ENSVE|nr:hypothetical protein B296_00033209 [Ensete ventricosum]
MAHRWGRDDSFHRMNPQQSQLIAALKSASSRSSGSNLLHGLRLPSPSNCYVIDPTQRSRPPPLTLASTERQLTRGGFHLYIQAESFVFPNDSTRAVMVNPIPLNVACRSQT